MVLIRLSFSALSAALLVTVRRLFRGRRDPRWSWVYEVIVEVLRGQVDYLVTAPPHQARRRLLEVPAWRLPRALRVEKTRIGGVPAECMKPEHWGPNGPTLLYLHGGGYGVGSPGTHRDLVGRLASQNQVRCVSLDYRLAPEHPFPAAVDDAVSAYRALIDEGVSPTHLTMGGDSAGGGLTLATLQRLRDSGDPLPAAILLLSPWVDLTCQGQSILDNADRCYLSRAVLNTFASHYHQDLDPERPLISPLYADLRGLPPMLILTGDAEGLYSENLALAARAREHGVDVTLHVGEGMVHVWPALTTFLAEGRPAMTAMADFLRPYSH